MILFFVLLHLNHFECHNWNMLIFLWSLSQWVLEILENANIVRAPFKSWIIIHNSTINFILYVGKMLRIYFWSDKDH